MFFREAQVILFPWTLLRGLREGVPNRCGSVARTLARVHPKMGWLLILSPKLMVCSLLLFRLKIQTASDGPSCALFSGWKASTLGH